MERPDFFSVSRGEMVEYLLTTASIAWPVWVLAIAGLALTAVGAFIDWRILMVGLMILLAILPSLSYYIYFSHMLDTHMIANVLPHTIDSHPGGYLVRIFREEPRHDAEHTDETEWVEAGRMTIFESKVKKSRVVGDFKVLTLVDSPVKVLYVPKELEAEHLSCNINSKH